MKSPFRQLADSVLRSTTTATGQSALPDWMVTPLAMLAGYDAAGARNKDAGWADEGMVRRAIALYRANGSRGGSQAGIAWQFSPNGRQAVQVLPIPANSAQQQAFNELSRRLESVTMNHPRLAPVLEAAMEQGYPFLAARIGEGFQSLTRRFGLPMEPEQAMRIVEQVTSALEYAHYRGVIHGGFDLNDILVNEQGQASLLGVGVEQMRQRLGATGVTVLSSLLPPEVASGAQPADMRTDVFAMGALLYILLTGRVPAAGQQIQLSHSIPAVPVAVDAVLTKALTVDPEERYPSLLEMNRDLRVALRAPRAVTRPSTPFQRSVEAAPVRRSPPPTTHSAPQPARAPGTTPDGFPEPLPMPDIDFSSLNQALEMPEVAAWVKIDIPPAPEIPKVDWGELLQLVDVSAFSSETISLPYAAAETLAPDPLVAAAMAVKATEQRQQSRQQAARQPANVAPRPQAAPPVSKTQPSAKPPAKPRRVRRQ
ncbi:MAG TPA: protein kinase [Anaerolineae bacterium]|nr:protein kinase [Anaerolineae bacterium]